MSAPALSILPLSSIRESWLNPRKTFDGAASAAASSAAEQIPEVL